MGVMEALQTVAQEGEHARLDKKHTKNRRGNIQG